MNFELVPLNEKHLAQFKKDMQEAFQQGAVDGFGGMEVKILPESHINRSLKTKGSVAYEAVEFFNKYHKDPNEPNQYEV